ncbi:Acetyl-CoA acetyltransferase [bioreactor metagenome]|uniref:Acetyl-CoA acetyltransferase n=1 Tax=bioreactor metagenome TaxID=1076179 RepID=A0A644W8S1_9ZZZZ
MEKCVIVSAVRTPVGRYLGGLKTMPAELMAAEVMKEAVRRAGIDRDQVEEVILGEVIGTAPDVARTAALLAGFKEDTPGYTIDRQCGSSLQAVVSAKQQLLSGDAEIILAGGTESMSRAPYYLPLTARFEGLRMGDKTVHDSFQFISGYNYAPVGGQQPEKSNMGLTAENVAEKYGITRQEQDAYALDSQRKTARAMAEGKFQEELLPLEVKEGKKVTVVDADEHPKPDTTEETLAKLKPAFKNGGTVTAGNASGMNDGASAVIMTTERKASALGLKPLCRVIASAEVGVDPRMMGMGPAVAIPRVLEKAGLRLEDIDLFEINEAFAAQTLGCLKVLGMEPGSPLYERVNVNGGAIAHGHALGNSGTRILTTLIYELRRRNGRYGIASLCIGGGQGIAVIIENCG